MSTPTGRRWNGSPERLHHPDQRANRYRPPEGRRGTVILTYSSPYATFSFVDSNGKMVAAGSWFAQGLGKSRVRICLAAHPDSPRYVDSVKVYRLGKE